ncbi:MAG: anti-sigma factor [Pseudomonadota bacterium]
MTMMNVDEEKLIAFIDGELDKESADEITRAATDDAVLSARIEEHRRLRADLSAAFDGVLSEPVPERLLQPLQGGAVVDLEARRAKRARWSVREWGAMAASLAAGLLIGLGSMSGKGALVAADASGLLARGDLEQALNTQLASDAGRSFRIGLTFRDKDGDFCRTFQASQQAIAGLACRQDANWRVAIDLTNASAAGEVRQAGSSMPPEILSAIEQCIDGDALDAAGERAARERGWRR